MVGDSLDKDILPALALGMRAIWIPAPADETRPPGDAPGAVPDRHRAAAPAGALVAHDLAAARDRLLELLGAPV